MWIIVSVKQSEINMDYWREVYGDDAITGMEEKVCTLMFALDEYSGEGQHVSQEKSATVKG